MTSQLESLALPSLFAIADSREKGHFSALKSASTSVLIQLGKNQLTQTGSKGSSEQVVAVQAIQMRTLLGCKA